MFVVYTCKNVVYGHVCLYMRISVLEFKRQFFFFNGKSIKYFGDLDLTWPLSNDCKECCTLQSIYYMEFLRKLGGLNENDFIMQTLSRQRAYITEPVWPAPHLCLSSSSSSVHFIITPLKELHRKLYKQRYVDFDYSHI